MKISALNDIDEKMTLIARSNNLDLESFKRLPRQKFIKLCNEYNSKK